jgi:hypothetical protein
MKKLVCMLLTAVFSLSFAGIANAETPTPVPTKGGPASARFVTFDPSGGMIEWDVPTTSPVQFCNDLYAKECQVGGAAQAYAFNLVLGLEEPSIAKTSRSQFLLGLGATPEAVVTDILKNTDAGRSLDLSSPETFAGAVLWGSFCQDVPNCSINPRIIQSVANDLRYGYHGLTKARFAADTIVWAVSLGALDAQREFNFDLAARGFDYGQRIFVKYTPPACYDENGNEIECQDGPQVSMK